MNLKENCIEKNLYGISDESYLCKGPRYGSWISYKNNKITLKMEVILSTLYSCLFKMQTIVFISYVNGNEKQEDTFSRNMDKWKFNS
ncbi:hypothetical protein CFP56_003937 [Quercus suber]|uniref:Uncharacterized protein n=1 Tax=Quercus suber TaxID=58331 RepID=A0AAW0IIB3_QUESU